jgi:V8-like Glu-specific endopeptidase
MSDADVESPRALADPNVSVESPAEEELTAVGGEPLVEPGAVGAQKNVSGELGGTGLDLIARRVLARRGIEPAALERGGGLESLGATESVTPLRDILTASTRVAAAPRRGLGPGRSSALESVILDHDGDGRERVFDTSHYPYSAIAALEITARDGSRYLGTGWFVSPHTLITAGHCVFVRNASPSANGWVRSIRVFPGRNGTGPAGAPFGSVVATRFRSVAGWVSDGNPESDYGAILLEPGSRPNGDEVGVFGIGAFDDAALRAMSLNVAGYPGDKEGSEAQTLWFDVKKTVRVSPKQVFYDIDTYGGQSGSAVYITRAEERVAVAIHAYGVSGEVTSNSGTRINPDVFERIRSWKS